MDIKKSGVHSRMFSHKAGTFVLTAPKAYHYRPNLGFNISEAVTYADMTCIDIGGLRTNVLNSRRTENPVALHGRWIYVRKSMFYLKLGQ